MGTPLYSKLKMLADQNPLRFHIPGHKGVPIFPLDFTELSATGNLYGEGEAILEAQNLWAVEYGFSEGLFLTGGSTQGVYTALGLCCKEGDTVLLDRGAHRSASNALALLGLEPVYLPRPWSQQYQVAGAIDPDTVEELLGQHPEIKTVFLTSPTTEGVLSDVGSISAVVKNHGAKLIVDGAHGAHLPWLMIDNYSSADVVCVSAHKTLPALGQSALIFYRDFTLEEVQEKASLFGTSSPSFLLMSSMDLAREWMNQDGMMEYVRVARQVATLRDIFPCIGEPLMLDPCRLCVICHDGKEVAKELEEHGIYLEMSSIGHLVAVFTALDQDKNIQQLGQALIPHLAHRLPPPDLTPPPQLPKQVLSPRQVLSAETVRIPWAESIGRVAAAHIAPFPPGIPVVAKGEEISRESLEYLERIECKQETVLVIA